MATEDASRCRITAAWAERLQALEAERADAEDRIASPADNAARAKALAATTNEQAQKLLKGGGVERGSSEERVAALAQLVERIVFDPARGTGQVFYYMDMRRAGDPEPTFDINARSAALSGVLVASPRGFASDISAFASRIEVPLEAWQRPA